MCYVDVMSLLRPTLMTSLCSATVGESTSSIFEKCLSNFKQAGLTVKLKKCCFDQDHTHYLGHMIGGGEVQPHPEKVQAVPDYPD